MIEVMRSREYPGSELVIETTLEPGENYDRFIASYLSEGNKIFGLLAVPNGPRPASGWPIILLNHGRERPETYDVTLRYRDHVDYFARNGYIVFHPAYRGHGESDGRAGDPFNNPNYTIDALNALAAVKTYPDADPGRIGMWGHSMGGFITLRAMVVSDEIDAGVIWAGVVGGYPDLFAREAATATAEAIASPTPEGTPAPSATPDGAPPPPDELSNWPRLVQTYGTPEENPAFWQSISATSYLADISGPLQLHHATTDPSVPVTVSLLLHEQMQAAGQLSELYLYEGDNHNIGRNFDVAMGRSLAFFDQHVKNSDE
jgi:dipeptidyl aminopeptidase/acylaminoacyl peptidase